ncbi:MAG: alpha/beta fold hydrolase [Verrucomicrobia bacterium]|nr:alpha/beta fold hydrolase [Verrucomicrobiota bacterium]
MKTKSTLLLCGLLLASLFNGFSQPSLQFSASSYTVAESAGSVTLTVQRTGDTNTEVGVDYATTDGTATNGFKYTAVLGTLTFGAGETNQTIVVPILDEGFVEVTKNFRVILSNPTNGAILGTRTNVPVSITDNDVGIQLQFATYSVAEDAGAVLIGVVRGDDGTNAVAVDFTTSNLTGTSGTDYTDVTNTLAIAPQERLRFVSIPILNNTNRQANRTFRVTLSNPVGLTLGSQKTTTVTIVDNDQGFAFESASYSVAEDAGAVQIRVLRGTDDTNSTATVDYATTDLTATNGLDYTGITNTLSFEPGEKVKLVTVPILNDEVKEPNKNFRVTLSNPTGGAVLGSRTTATVAIVDNDPGVGFERTQYTNEWGNAGGISVTILRGNDLALGPITVDYATSNLTAVAGIDYQAVSGTIAFQQNETVKTLTVPLLQPRAAGGPKTFRVTLSNATGGATLGTASTTVKIVGAYFSVAPPFDTALTIQSVGGLNTLTWTGGGLLQRADGPTGPWQTLTTATNPYTVQSPLPTTFYRVTRPRPVNLYVPSIYDGQTPVPLLILLHGYGYNGVQVEAYMQFRPLAEARGFLYCYPESTADPSGTEFWNATDALGDFYNSGVDDAGYLRSLIQEIERQFAVDRKRVYLIGHSNGGFMAYRMACQFADIVAGIASLAGTTFLDPSRCQPSQPVNILHIHGTGDDTIFYAGGATVHVMPAYPGALQTVRAWAGYNDATDPVTDPTPSMHLDLDTPGLDTVITRYSNSPPGGAVELWTMNPGAHVPTLYTNGVSSEFAPRVIDWLLAHPKP